MNKYNFFKKSIDLCQQYLYNNDLLRDISGDNGVEEILLSIPNRTVKLYSANGTAWETVWESRTLPGRYALLAQLVEHLTLNQGVPGSNP